MAEKYKSQVLTVPLAKDGKALATIETTVTENELPLKFSLPTVT